MRKYLYGFISFSLIIISLSCIMVWEFYLSDRINKLPVYIAVKPIDGDTVIQDDSIKLVKRKYDELPPDYIVDPSEIIGKKSSISIEPNDVITKGKMNSKIQEEGKSIYPIPQQWIEALPGSLKRGDKVDVFLTLPKDNKVTAKVEASGSVTSQGKTEEAKVQATAVISRGDAASFNPDEPILKNSKVAYVRDSNNKSILINQGTPEDRTELTGNPSKQELLISSEDFIKVKKAVESGYKLLFSY